MHAEGDAGTTDFTFTVSRTGDVTSTGTVDYAVVAHGDLDGNDFDSGSIPTGTVTFGVGEVEQTLTLTVSGDVEVEADEAFVVRLSNVSGGQLGVSQALGLIEADDVVGAPTFELSTAPSPLGLTAVGLESRVTLGDLDGDGDLDALVSDATGILSYFENTGSASAPAYVPVGGTALRSDYPIPVRSVHRPWGTSMETATSTYWWGSTADGSSTTRTPGMGAVRRSYGWGVTPRSGYPTPVTWQPRRWWTSMRTETWTCSWATSTGGYATSKTSGMWKPQCFRNAGGVSRLG